MGTGREVMTAQALPGYRDWTQPIRRRLHDRALGLHDSLARRAEDDDRADDIATMLDEESEPDAIEQRLIGMYRAENFFKYRLLRFGGMPDMHARFISSNEPATTISEMSSTVVRCYSSP